MNIKELFKLRTTNVEKSYDHSLWVANASKSKLFIHKMPFLFFFSVCLEIYMKSNGNMTWIYCYKSSRGWGK